MPVMPFRSLLGGAGVKRENKTNDTAAPVPRRKTASKALAHLVSKFEVLDGAVRQNRLRERAKTVAVPSDFEQKLLPSGTSSISSLSLSTPVNRFAATYSRSVGTTRCREQRRSTVADRIKLFEPDQEGKKAS